MLHAQHARVVAVSDKTGGTFNEGGLDVPALWQHSLQGGRLPEFGGGEPITGVINLLLNSYTFA